LIAPAGDALVGIEIHQQLKVRDKLFCSCPPTKSEEFPYVFERKLRPAQSETGGVDPAAVFEYAKGKSNVYLWSPESSCLVEADEEPPHALSDEAVDSALIVAKTLGSNIVDEIHVMRKMVIDGSNTGGFQRTVVIGLGGGFPMDGVNVGVQSVTLEEDAARILGEDAISRKFALDRLGVALVEIALEPIVGDPDYVGEVALHVGRTLRSTGRVARGLGTIRQDLNVSTGGGSVVEVKGVQKLNLLPKVVDYEIRRQRGLNALSKKLKDGGIRRIECKSKDVTAIMENSGSALVRNGVSNGAKVTCVKATGLMGLLGWEPSPGIRLGKEIAEVARANSLGGVIHSDEFEKQGISNDEETMIRKETGSRLADALVLLVGPEETLGKVVPLIEIRLNSAVLGVSPETRAATDTGETRYMRPRPGSQRMYPETDIPDILIDRKRLEAVSLSVPSNWKDNIRDLRMRYDLSEDLALKMFDSDLLGEFETLATSLKLAPSFVAAVLVDLPARLEREGVPADALTLSNLTELLKAVEAGTIAKEAVPEVLHAVGQRNVSVSEAIGSLGLEGANESQIRSVVDRVIATRKSLIAEKGEAAFSSLMGEAMKELRGKADGAKVSGILKETLAAYMKGTFKRP
jgi:glutamyl-tRNA(Gln) amidotransferase subunit E